MSSGQYGHDAHGRRRFQTCRSASCDSALVTCLWSRLPLPEQHVAGLLVGFAFDRLVTAARLPIWSRPVGVVLGVGGVAVNVAAVRARGEEDLERPSRLVDRGPYAWSRNPMYLGWSMIHLGLALTLRSPGMAATWPAAVISVHRGILAEERQLAARFGKDFAAYAATVPRYLDGRVRRGITQSARARVRTRRPRFAMRHRAS